MDYQGVKREEQLKVKCENTSSCAEDTLHMRNEQKVVGHRSYTADLYNVELLIQK